MPPQIKPVYQQLYFRFWKAEKLPEMDVALIGKGSIDAYVKYELFKKKLISEETALRYSTSPNDLGLRCG